MSLVVAHPDDGGSTSEPVLVVRCPRRANDASATVEEHVRAVVHLTLCTAAGTLPSLDLGAGMVASSARGDVHVIAGARRRVNRLAAARPSRITKQAAALVRRALEVGDWDWEAYQASDVRPAVLP